MKDLHEVPDDVLDTRLDHGQTHREWLQREAARRRAESIREAPRPSSYGTPVRFGDAATRAAHVRKCTAIQRCMHAHQYEVAPLHTVLLPDGSLLREGSEVRVAMFDDAPLSSWQIMTWLVNSGIVLESLVYVPPDSGPQAA